MTVEEKIEEVAKEFCPLFKEYGACETCDAILDIGDNPCVHKNIASLIIAHGYCKASEVAEEIFEEIEKALSNARYISKTSRKTVKVEELKEQAEWILHEAVLQIIEPIKKKYAESEDTEGEGWRK